MDNKTPVSFDTLEQALSLYTEQIQKLSARVVALEERRLMSFEGAHDPGKSYQSGAVVQRSGALFVAMAGTNDSPGASVMWRQIGVCK